MRSVHRSLRLAASLCLAAAAIGCGLFDAVPGRQLDLTGTTWEFVEIDGEPLDRTSFAAITFPSGPVQDEVLVDTGCREVGLRYALDTDGSALGFAVPPATTPRCPPHLLGRDAAIFEALRATETWAVVGQDAIEFRGLHVVRLAMVGED